MKKTVIWACALMLAGLVVLAGCGGSSKDSGATPEETVKKFFDANIAMDVDALWLTLSKESQETLDKEQMKEAASQPGAKANYTYKIGKTDTKGDSATVEVTLTEGSQEFPVTMSLVKEGGAWKVDFLKSFGASQAPEEPSETPEAPVEEAP